MSTQRLAYDDQDPTATMHIDCTACVSSLGLSLGLSQRTISTDALTAPSIGFDAFPREIRKPEITVSAAAAHLASRMHLHY